MDLITPELRILLLASGHTARDNPPVLKWFNPCGAATWLITELDPGDEDLAWGLCDLGLGSPENGSCARARTGLHPAMRGALGIERDLHWRADKPLSDYLRLARAAGRIVS